MSSFLQLWTSISIFSTILFAATASDTTYASQATITASGNGASGKWTGTGLGFNGASDLSQYIVEVDSPNGDIKGSVNFTAIAPAHYPCGPVEAGVSMAYIPQAGWAIGISDADAKIDLLVNGTVVKFTGVGYHDHNWGIIPFFYLVQGSIWGYGRFGPFSIVWSKTVAIAAGVNSTTGYVARDGEILTFGCSSITFTSTSDPSAYHVEIDLGREGVLEFDVSQIALIDASGPGYNRWTGTLSGGIKGQQTYSGVALYEQLLS